MLSNLFLTKEKVVTAYVQKYDFEKKAFVVQINNEKELIALEDMSIYQNKKGKNSSEKIYFYKYLGNNIKCIQKQNFLHKKFSRAEYMKRRIDNFEVGNIINATVVSASNEALYLEFDEGLSGIMYIKQLTSSKINHPLDIYNPGDKIRCKITGKKDNLFTLSRLALFKDVPLNVKLGKVLDCRIIKKVDENDGYYVEIEKNPLYSGIFNIYEDSREYQIGERIKVKVIQYKGKKLRLRPVC